MSATSSMIALFMLTVLAFGGAQESTTSVPDLKSSSSSASARPTRPSAENAPRCIDIPDNLTACRGFGYMQMRLPNLFNHSTAVEATRTVREDGWMTVLADGCSPGASLFLCSLLSPVCLDRPVWPCRSLCEEVKSGCSVMLIAEGQSWPESMNCTDLPSDDDELCLGLQTSSSSHVAGFSVSQMPRDPAVDAPSRNRSKSSRKRRKPLQRRNKNQNRRNSMRQSRLGLLTADARNWTCPICGEVTLEKLCGADFVAKVRPARYIRVRSNLKLIASTAVQFYKSPPSTSRTRRTGSRRVGRRKSVFFVYGGADCDCLGAEVQQSRRQPETGSYLLLGHLERDRQERLVVTSAIPFRSRIAVRRALRTLGDPNTCDVTKKRQTEMVATGGGKASQATRSAMKQARKDARRGNRRARRRRQRRRRTRGQNGRTRTKLAGSASDVVPRRRSQSVKQRQRRRLARSRSMT